MCRRGDLTLTMSQILKVDSDAFSAGQIESKIWAAENLELVLKSKNIDSLRMYILGGWYSLLHFILQVRNNVQIDYCRSIDLDIIASHNANLLNNTWHYNNWQFRAYPEDANKIDFTLEQINCVINTSTEHFSSDLWFENIPKGTVVLLQGNDFDLEDHVRRPANLDDFCARFALAEILYKGQKTFDFKTIMYNRYMLVGIK